LLPPAIGPSARKPCSPPPRITPMPTRWIASWATLNFERRCSRGGVQASTCLAGTMVQEVYTSHPDIARACEATIYDQAAEIEKDIEAAMKQHRIRAAQWTAASLALHAQAVVQGAIILAKAKGGVDVAIETLDHLRRYVEFLFGKERRQASTQSGGNKRTKGKRT
jgi:TetR/AcrR family transcriptional regulator, transcriptional repressor for nem operon